MKIEPFPNLVSITCIRYDKGVGQILIFGGYHSDVRLESPPLTDQHKNGGFRFRGEFDAWHALLAFIATLTGKKFLSAESVGQFDPDSLVYTFYREDSAMGERIAQKTRR